MKDSKARRKKNRIRQLEKKVAEQKKDKTQKEIQTVHMDEVQIDEFLKALTERVEWSTNRIVDEQPRPIIVERDKTHELGGVATLLKWSIGVLFFIAATLIVHFLCTAWNQYWAEGWTKIAILIIGIIAAIDCGGLGIEICREKDRDYIVALFSGFVALTALVVALTK